MDTHGHDGVDPWCPANGHSNLVKHVVEPARILTKIPGTLDSHGIAWLTHGAKKVGGEGMDGWYVHPSSIHGTGCHGRPGSENGMESLMAVLLSVGQDALLSVGQKEDLQPAALLALLLLQLLLACSLPLAWACGFVGLQASSGQASVKLFWPWW